MAKATILALMVIGAMLPASPSSAQGAKTCAVTTAAAPLHAGPSSSSRVVIRAPRGMWARVIGRSGEWVRIIGDGEAGEHGHYGSTWIQARYLTSIPCDR